MSVTVSEVLKDALGLCNALEIDETPASYDMALALRAANMMLGSWSAQHLILRSNQLLSFATTAGQASYTIGPSGQDITAAKPLRIESAVVVDATTNYPVEVIADDQFEVLVDQATSSGRPIYLSYDPGDAQQTTVSGTIRFYYTPDKAYTARLQTHGVLTELTNYTDVLTFESEYREAFVYNLAMRLFRRYNDEKTPIPMDIVVMARDSINLLKTLNSDRVTAQLDLPGRPARYNVYTDQS